jgi:hypothetical protein
MTLVAEHPKHGAGPPPAEGAPTELDVKLPSKIALAHAEETFEQRTTLPRVELPSRAALATPLSRVSSAPGVPRFSAGSFPPPAPPGPPAAPPHASVTGPHPLPARPHASVTGPHPLPARPHASVTGPHPLPARPQASVTGPHPLPARPEPGEPVVPPFDAQSFPPLDAEFFRPTEMVKTPKIRLGLPWIVLMLLGVLLGTGVTILLLSWLR